jgi:hypothetical protein
MARIAGAATTVNDFETFGKLREQFNKQKIVVTAMPKPLKNGSCVT